MFNRTWKWAGKFRHSGKNIGIDWPMIPEELQKLCADVRYQLEHKSFPDDEIAVRMHHRLVSIHPFPNGNGRHARLISDMYLHAHGEPLPIWPSGDIAREGGMRDDYLAALRAGDKNDFVPLIRLQIHFSPAN